MKNKTFKILRNLIYKIKRLVMINFYRGNKLLCPICLFKAEKFFDYGLNNKIIKEFDIIGMGFRKNVICPNCYSKDRERLVFLFLDKLLKAGKINYSSKIIHFSPEKSIKNNFFKKKFNNYVTADYEDKEADLLIDLQIKKVQKNNFDLVICNHVMEHLIDDQTALYNLYNMLKPGGFAILQAPFSKKIIKDIQNTKHITDEERILNYGQKDHVRIYSEEQYLKKIQSAGFTLNIDNMENENNSNPSYGLNFKEKVIFAIR